MEWKDGCDGCIDFGIFEQEERVMWCNRYGMRLPPYKVRRPCDGDLDENQ